jgi:hypothetical protein
MTTSTITDSTLHEALVATMIATGWDVRRVMSFLVDFLADKHKTVSEIVDALNLAAFEETRPAEVEEVDFLDESV